VFESKDKCAERDWIGRAWSQLDLRADYAGCRADIVVWVVFGF
jgi:hypothetical protein